MKLPKLKWPVVALTFGACLILLFAGYWFWQHNAIRGPLKVQLAQVAGVADVSIENGRNGLRFEITASPEVNFVQTAPAVRNLIAENVSGKTEIIWIDNRSDQLAELRQSINLILREAQIRHEYVVMAERIEARLKTKNVTIQLGVDEESIYLALQDGAHTWQEVLPIIGLGGGEQ